MRKRFILYPPIIFLVLLAGYEFYFSVKGRDMLTAAHLMEGIALASPIKMQVIEFYSMRGELPSSNTELGLPEPESLSGRSVKSIKVTSGGKIIINYNNALKKDSSVILMPSITTADSIYGLKWTCVTESIEPAIFEKISMRCAYIAPGDLSRLMESIAAENEVGVQAAINTGVDVNSVMYGETPLFSAISLNQYSIARQLINAGADVNRAPSSQRKITPLMHSIISGKEKIADLLLDHGANIDAGDNAGKTALMYGIEKGRENIVDLLLSHGANPLLKDGRGKDALRYAKRYGRRTAMSGLIEIAVRVYKAELARDGVVGGENDLMRAAKRGNIKKVRQLITEGVSVGEVDNFNSTALYYALEAQQLDITKLLINAGITTNNADRDGFTPLMLAVKTGNSKLVSMLLKAGAKVNVKNKYQRTPFLMAVRYGYKNIVSLLLDVGVTESVNKALYESFVSPASKKDSADVQQLVFGAGLTFDHDEKSNAILLTKAVQKGRVSMARFLLQNDVSADPNAEYLPLHVAAQNGDYDMARLLVKFGANINAVTGQGRTSLIFAVKSRNVRLVKYFLSAGAKTDAIDVDGLSALRMARLNFSEEIVELLRKHKK